MSDTELDLWPDATELAKTSVEPPLTLLRQQAALIGEKTKNLIIGEVITRRVPLQNPVYALDIYPFKPKPPDEYSTKQIEHHFVLSSPALDDYCFTLFSARHAMNLYPVLLFCTLDDNEAKVECKTEEELKEGLSVIFHNESTLKVIQGLLAQYTAQAF